MLLQNLDFYCKNSSLVPRPLTYSPGSGYSMESGTELQQRKSPISLYRKSLLNIDNLRLHKLLNLYKILLSDSIKVNDSGIKKDY